MAKITRDPMDPISLGNTLISAEMPFDGYLMEQSASPRTGKVSWSLHQEGVLQLCCDGREECIVVIGMLRTGMSMNQIMRTIHAR